MINLLYQTGLTLVFGRIERVTACTSRGSVPHDPLFLPDWVTLMPDQAQELCYGLGRKR